MSLPSSTQKFTRAQRQQAIQMQMLKNRNLLCSTDEPQRRSEHPQIL